MNLACYILSFLIFSLCLLIVLECSRGRGMRQADRSNKNKTFSERLMWLQVFFAGAIAIFILYLFAVQVLDVRHFRIKAKNQRRANSFRKQAPSRWQRRCEHR